MKRNYRINYLNINDLNLKKINEFRNIIIYINAELDKIEKLYKIINVIKIKNLINDKKINIIFRNSKKEIDYYVLKMVFRKYNVIRNKSKDVFIEEKKINKINIE